MTLDEFIRICEQNGYHRWSISRTQEPGERGEPLESFSVSIDGVFSISATERTREDAILTVLSVVEAVHGLSDRSVALDITASTHHARRDVPRGGVS